MELGDRVPLIIAGSTGRNVVVGIGYLFTFVIWMVLLPFIAAIFVWRNSYRWAEMFSALLGINARGGLVAEGVAFVYVIVLFGILGAALLSCRDGPALAGER